MKKKLLALTLAALMALSLAACGGTADTGETESTETAESTGTVYKIGICQLAPHVALDAAPRAFIDAVTEGLGAENVDIDNQNAAGDSPTCATIINGFVSADVDLILATPPRRSRPLPPPPPPSRCWAPPSPSTAWPWALTASPVPWAPTSPAPPTWRRWTSRPPW